MRGISGGTLQRRTVLRLGLLSILMMLLSCVAAYGLYYYRTGKPLPTMLPIVEGLGRGVAPHFVFNVYGVTEPMGVATSRDGNTFYVAENGGQRQIVAFDRSGRELFRTNPPDTTLFTRLPQYIAMGPEGTLYVADRMMQEVQMYAPTGDYLGSIKSPFDDPVWAPIGVAVDKLGNTYVVAVTDVRQQVVIFDKDLKFVRSFGKMGKAPGEMNLPDGIAVGDDGKIYVSSAVGGRIDAFDTEGNYLAPEGAEFIPSNLPKGLYLDDLERLYSVDTTNSVVSVFDLLVQPPKLLFNFGAVGGTDGAMRFPTGIAGDATGRIYIADRVNNRVQVWSY